MYCRPVSIRAADGLKESVNSLFSDLISLFKILRYWSKTCIYISGLLEKNKSCVLVFWIINLTQCHSFQMNNISGSTFFLSRGLTNPLNANVHTASKVRVLTASVV